MVQINSDCSIAAQICQQARLSRDARFDGQFLPEFSLLVFFAEQFVPLLRPMKKMSVILILR